MAKITLIGDAHGKMARLQGLQAKYSRTIQLGDMGFGFTIVPSMSIGKHVFIRGNHDDPALCAAHPNYLGDFGYIENGSIFYVSGAFSIDWMMRIEGRSWWREEELSPNQLQEAIDLYSKLKPRYVISHECPSSANKVLLEGLMGAYFAEKATLTRSRTCQALQAMLEAHQPERWIFGHYHVTKGFAIGDVRTQFQCLAELDTMELDTDEEKL